MRIWLNSRTSLKDSDVDVDTARAGNEHKILIACRTVTGGRALMRLFAILALSPAYAQGQPRLIIPDGAPCADCRVSLVMVARLGGATERDGLIADNSRLAVDSRGRYYVAPTAVAGQVHVFDAEGRAVGVLGGRAGKGPGEMDRIVNVFTGAGDTIHVFDSSRHSWFSAMQYRGVVPAPRYVVDAEFLRDGTSIQTFLATFAGTLRTEFVHVLAPNGDIRKSFGAPIGIGAPLRTDTYGPMRSIALSADSGRFWVAHASSYVMEEWDTAGTLLRTVTRNATWFPPWSGRTRAGPLLMDIWEDKNRLLWTLINIPGGVRIEVLDIDRGRLVAASDFPGNRISRFLNGFVGAVEEQPDGNVVMAVYRVTASLRTLRS